MLMLDINNLIYINRGLNEYELKYIKKNLNIEQLKLLINLRYPPDPLRYNKMTKTQLINELKYSRYD
jgi:hypothetical protein